MSAEKEKLEEKMGEALGLEIAAQKAVEELGSKGLLNEAGMKAKLDKMRKEANNHQTKLEELVQKLSQSQGLNPENIQSTALETERKATQMMYEVLSTMAVKKVKNKQFSTAVNSILREERRHLQLCTRLAKQVAAS